MSNILDSVVNSLSTATVNTSHQLLKAWLTQLYDHAPIVGLDARQIYLLVRLICESTAISASTKVYIIDHCLLPNDYIDDEVVLEIINHLGTPTVTNPYRILPPKSVQIKLCKWLVHVFILLPKDRSNLNPSVWLHLWKYSFLQYWLTYIIIWSTNSKQDVKSWKVTLIEKIAFIPGYPDVAALATLILNRFESIVGSTPRISSLRLRINTNMRSYKAIQNLELDSKFISALKKVLFKSSPNKFPLKYIDDVISSYLSQLKNKDNSIVVSQYRQKVPPSKLFILDIRTFEKLVWNWNNIVVPKNPEFLFDIGTQAGFKISALKLAGDDPQLSNKSIKYITVQLKRCFNNNENLSELERLNILKNVVRFCILKEDVLESIVQEFFTIEFMNSNPNIFVTFFNLIFPLFKPESITDFRKLLLRFFTRCRFSNQTKATRTVFPRLCKGLLLMIKNWYSTEGTIESEGYEIFNDIKLLLVSHLQNSIENRYYIISVNVMLSIVLNIYDYENSATGNAHELMIIPNVMNKLLTIDDPLLLDSCCLYLINSKELLKSKASTNKQVQRQNQYILDLTNYLWRNKISTSKYLFHIPTELVKNTIENIYLPDIENKLKSMFSITGVPSLSYYSSETIKPLITEEISYFTYNDVINEENFKKLIKDNQQNETFNEIRIKLLQSMLSDSPYPNVSIFLFTYLKSLSQYYKNEP
ncbi:hypothetical protein Kpol_483p9 [Vanderwaltozyma polyspora DSM 70294]|uniref:Uncharacterized protein n=1 Tax=Vanderwaltozyma polyspora (strain ATCC 22028 / DSM 70294 / BCRC 21397 / CBS 2163 / NBRC 10782 / NRRL Y-8283 / UCD 57-17) TaxID=436907 RepID=A7TQ61_VANPO|nr:uncharacterized protein Kpol_483p9 [Vanderwaltozyma polyspora DSM 70294]EDO15590.1 hypothetical protein Kpol_483p9 [Vanderwaltozyma polyspora DSM 70294]